MLQNKYLKDWSKIVSNHFPDLSLPEVSGLATWSFGIVITGSSSLTRVSEFIAKINGEKSNTVKQRLKEWYQDSEAKKGKKRKELDVNQCFAPLLKWILSLWNSEEKWLPLAIDATNIGQNFTVLSLHVLYQGCGIPVAWKIVKGTEKGSWKPHWLHLFQSLKDTVVPKIGMSWSGNVTCFKSNPLDCTLLARWDEGYQEPWLIVTDLEPSQGNTLWYGFRSWIESSYRDVKSDGWQWHKTRLREPARAERLWLAMAVATLWTVTMGSDEQRNLHYTLKDKRIAQDEVQQKSELKKTNRNISCFLQGLINIIADLLCGKGISLHGLFPQTSFIVNTS